MLKGKRVTLRAVTREDLPRYCEFKNDLNLHFLASEKPPVPLPLEALEKKYEADVVAGESAPPWFAIEADGKFIGQCGIWRIDGIARIGELGIAIGDPEYWGNGYGRETVGLLLEYAFRYRNLRRVWLTTGSDNERAIRCYRACGFVEEGRLREHGWVPTGYIDVVQMGILVNEWKP